MNNGDVLIIKRFVQKITDKPFAIDHQPHKREGVFVWCTDWELIEIGKCLFMGEEVYLGDPPPRRLRYNPLWNQQEIVNEARRLTAVHADVHSLLSELESRRASYANGG